MLTLLPLRSRCHRPTGPADLVHQYLRLEWRAEPALPVLDPALRPRRHLLEQAVRLAWIDLPFNHPAFSFERYALTSSGLEALVLGPHAAGTHPPLRGVAAHFKAMVTRLLAGPDHVWRPGCEIVPLPDQASKARTRTRLDHLARCYGTARREK